MRIPLIGQPSLRDITTTKDRLFYNSLFEKNEEPAVAGSEYRVLSRPGLVQNVDVANGTGRGIYAWNGKIYSVVGNLFYSGTTALATLATSTGPVKFEEQLTAGTTISLSLSDGVDGYIISTADIVTTITDVDFPDPHTVGFVFMDGYLFAANTTGQIRNSDLEVYTSWVSTNEISAELYGDKIKSLTRFNNLIVAIGERSTEFFENVANPTGSPLGRVLSYAFQMGTQAPFTVVKTRDAFTWVAEEPGGNPSVHHFNGKLQKLSNPHIDRILVAEGSALPSANAYSLSMQGHFLYVLQLASNGRTLVFDFHSGLWNEWTSDNGAGSQIKYRGQFGTFLEGSAYLQHATTGQILIVDPTTSADEANAILWKGRLQLVDAGTHHRKRHKRLVFIADQTTSASTLNVRYSDDDWQTFSANRPVDLSIKYPALLKLGSARHRGYEFSHSSSTQRIRLEGIDLDISTKAMGGTGG
jgi:hypothetical protein